MTLALFMAAVELLALYGISVSGHFPAEVRTAALKSGIGALTLWTTLVAAVVAAILVFAVALGKLPWTSMVIGGGAMLLAAPLLLRVFPDRFVDGLAALVVFAAGGVAAALALSAAWALH
jgi:hypothetical protein